MKRQLILTAILLSTTGLATRAQAVSNSKPEALASQELANALAKYDRVGDFHDGLALVVKASEEYYDGWVVNGKYGYINIYGEEVIPCNITYYVYGLHPDFSEGLAAISVGDNCGYLNTRGELEIPAIYGNACPFSDGTALVYVNGEGYIYIDKNGNKIIDCPNERPAATDRAGGSYYDFKDGLLEVVTDEDKYGIIDKNGQFIVPAKYDAVDRFSDDLVKVKLNGKSGFVNKNGDIAIPLKYDDGGYFSEGLGYVKTGGKWGFIDCKGNIVMPFKYDDALGFHEGLAPVKYNGKWGYIDKQGEVVIPYKFDSVKPFKNGYAIVESYNRYGVIDKTGQYIIPNSYDYDYDYNDEEGLLILRNEKGNYLYTIDGKQILSIGPEYRMRPFSEGLALILRDYSYVGVVDKYGNVYYAK